MKKITRDPLTSHAHTAALHLVTAMAATRRWDLVRDGRVPLRHLPPQLRDVVDWVLEARHTSGGDPSLEALRVTFAGVGWPEQLNVPDLVVEPFLQAFLDATKDVGCADLAKRLFADARPLSVGSETYDTFIDSCRAQLLELQALGKTGGTGRRFGMDAEETLASFLGNRRIGSAVSTPWEGFNERYASLTPGLYGFYSRPKQGKSWIMFQLAIENGIRRGIPTLIIDVENDTQIVTRRLVCAYLGIDFDKASDAANRLSQKMELSEEQTLLMSVIAEGVQALQEESRIVILSKSDVDPRIRFLTTDTIRRNVEDHGIEVICADQVQKYWASGISTPHEKLNTRVMSVLDSLDLMQRVVFFTTQENREGEAKEQEFNWHTPSSRTIYGSDAAAQLCTVLYHVRNLELTEGVRYTDRFGQDQEALYLQCWWPLFSRIGGGSGINKTLFRVSNACDFEMFLDHEAGFRMFDDQLSRNRKDYNYNGKSKNAGAIEVGRGKAPSRVSRMRDSL